MQYISVKGNVIDVDPYAIQLFQSSMHLVERSDTSRNFYPRVAFMTVFALHPKVIIQGGLL